MRSLDIAATGMIAQQMNIEVISNNIANITTSGYKRQRAEFQDLLYQSQQRVGSRSSDAGTIVPTGIQLGLGVKPGSVYRVNEQGTIAQTENPLDVAVQGKGFFSVQLPSGEFAYTRAGSFKLSADGEIVTAEGYTVQPGIVVPVDALGVTINASGEVSIRLFDQTDEQILGQLELTTFVNEAGLEALGDNLFKETTASGGPVAGIPGEAGVGTLLQGALENSNVEPVTEVTQLITAQRAYEFNSKIITASDEMMQTVNNAKR